AECLKTLAISLTDRYKRFRELEDLTAALQSNQEAVDLTPEGHPGRADLLKRLAVSFTARYHRFGELDDLMRALKNNEKALDLTPEGHPRRAHYLESLAGSLRDKYKQLGDLNDLQASIQKIQEAVNLVPEGHPDRAIFLSVLATALGDRFRYLGNLNDLEVALQIKKEAVELTPEEHPDRAEHLYSLANSLADRYKRLGDLEDLEDCLENFQKAVKLAPAGHPDRIEYLDSLAVLLAAFELLPEILWISHSIPVRQDAIRRIHIGEATSAATRSCIALSYLHSAVEILEQGLGTTFQQMLQLKTDVELEPEQENLFKSLSSALYSGGTVDAHDIANQRQHLLENIRKQPGLKHFLLPKPYSTLCHASREGPVVILNSHKDSCDGIIILNPTSEPVHVPLPNVTLDMLQSYQCFADILTWLWSYVITPVYEVLELHGIHNGRLWWLPTGAFTGLPLHASPPTNQFIHSYTATLGSLIEAHAKKSSPLAKFGITGVTHT
ncbi:hypothetical protein B0H17DRAFT_852124, partial [Mycena rosella]